MEVTKKVIVDEIAEKLEMTKAEAKDVFEAVFDIVSNHLVAGEDVAILGIGKFKVVERAARTARNPQDGSKIEIPAKKVVRFAPAKSLKEGVAGL